MSERIPVSATSKDEYEITVGSKLLHEITAFVNENYGSQKAILLIDQNVNELHGKEIGSALDPVFEEIVRVIIPAGESRKSLTQFAGIVDQILTNGVERRTPLIAFGGGVTGDLAGFVAASVLRGIPLIHVPTTLLAMVDSAIGGKTGVNHESGKNLIGAFYQPDAVFADVRFLETLPREEWVSGLSEVIKYGMIESPEILNTLDTLIRNGIFAEPEQWIPVIAQSARIKADIVNRDVKESGVREFLNFGHTFAHVIETAGDYSRFSHGEAVFAGMYGAVYASNKLGAEIDTDLLDRFKILYSFSFDGISADPSAFTRMMLRDKKAQKNTIRLVLLENTGKPVVKAFEETSLVEESWNHIFNTFN